MKHRLLIILILFFSVAVPAVNGQVEVSAHNITFELMAGAVHVEEVIVFENPTTSEIHTFAGSISLFRGNVEGFSLKGTDWTIVNDSFPTLVKLDFSKKPIYRSATQNTRNIVLDYDTPDFTRKHQLDGREVYVFSGNILIPLPLGLNFKDTNIKITLAEGLRFGQSTTGFNIVKDESSYHFSGDERLNADEFFLEVEYGEYQLYALSDIEKTEAILVEARKNAADAKEAVTNLEIYGIDTAKANSDLSRAMELIGGSESYLKAAKALLETDDPYKAYLAANNSLSFAQEADLLAKSAESEANLQLRLSLNERISQLENMTATRTPPSTVSESDNNTNQTSQPPPTSGPKETETPKQQIEDSSSVWFYSFIPYLILFLALLGLSAIYISKHKKRKRKFGAVRDFRAISDLKRKSYRDFEEKVLDVKKETTIAGDIRALKKEKAKYELGIENLNKRKIAGELTDETYNLEKQRFLETIKGLDKRIEMLDKELPKGATDEKSVTDKPEDNS